MTRRYSDDMDELIEKIRQSLILCGYEVTDAKNQMPPFVVTLKQNDDDFKKFISRKNYYIFSRYETKLKEEKISKFIELVKEEFKDEFKDTLINNAIEEIQKYINEPVLEVLGLIIDDASSDFEIKNLKDTLIELYANHTSSKKKPQLTKSTNIKHEPVRANQEKTRNKN